MAEQQESGGNRQKIMIGIMVVVVGVIIWQMMGLFGGGSTGSAPQPTLTPTQQQVRMDTPKPAKVAKPEVMSEREAQLMRLQQETEAKYVAALNELQMLRVEKEIADTNKQISKAKLDSVKAQKDIVDLLTEKPEPVQSLTPNLRTPTALTPTQQQGGQTETTSSSSQKVKYSVISVSRVHSKWNAVLAAQGKLYNVQVGDIMPVDGAKILRIDNTGVTVQRDDKKEKISLVPII